MDQAFIDNIAGMKLAQLKDAYLAAIVEDDELGVPVMRPDAEKRAAIFARVAELIADDSDYDPEGGESEPDFDSAAKDFLERE